jgi:hypothetical protein
MTGSNTIDRTFKCGCDGLVDYLDVITSQQQLLLLLLNSELETE